MDGYYGNIDGVWTDGYVYNVKAKREDNKNIPGDGKFDASYFPSNIEIEVGRIDFSDLPSFLDDEASLTSKYLQKNVAFRMGKLQVPDKILMVLL